MTSSLADPISPTDPTARTAPTRAGRAKGSTSRRLPMLLAVAALGALGLAACGTNTTSNGSGTTAGSAGAGTGSATTVAGITISSASVSGVGTVLVNGSDGKTLYILTSEAGGKITCTDASGCTSVWPDTELAAGATGATAGSGITSSLLSTVKDSAGSLYVTYAGYPLYEYVGDHAAGTANGEGITSFGGTWEAMATNGTPVVKATSATTSSGY